MESGEKKDVMHCHFWAILNVRFLYIFISDIKRVRPTNLVKEKKICFHYYYINNNCIISTVF